MEIKKPWYDHSPRARHPGMQSQVGLGSVTTNKASRLDGIPVELLQILKYNALKVLRSICQQIWKTAVDIELERGPFSFQSQ